MSENDSVSGKRGLQARNWVLVGVVLLLLLALGIVVVTLGDDPPAREGSAQPNTAAPTGPTCLPQIVETGYTKRNGTVKFGIIAENTCAKAAVNNVIKFKVLDAGGKRLDNEKESLAPELLVMLPGQRLGASGSAVVGSAMVATLQVEFTESTAMDPGAFAGWPDSVTVQDVKHSGPDSRRLSTVTGTLRVDPPNAKPCNPTLHLILRDRAGRIVYGERWSPSGVAPEPRFEGVFPESVDHSRTEVYVAQGAWALPPLPADTASCKV